jgi:hypothetical protein
LSAFFPELSVLELSVLLLDPLLVFSVNELLPFLLKLFILSLRFLSLDLLDPIPMSLINLSAFLVEPLTGESDAGFSDFLPKQPPLSDARVDEKRVA